MKKIQIFIAGIILATMISCSAEDQASQIEERTPENSQEFVKIDNTPEMVDFKNALSELTRTRVADQAKKRKATSLFDAKNQELITDAAKALLLSADYKDADLKKMDDRRMIQTALKVYAKKTQLQLIK